MFYSPIQHPLEVSAFMSCIEVRIRSDTVFYPIVCIDANVTVTLELLAQEVRAVV